MRKSVVILDEVITRSTQGVTRPFVCRGDDQALYYVKGKGAGRRSQICEWVAAQLATFFGLPVAEYALAEVSEELIEAKAISEIADLGIGTVFASKEVPHPQELNATTRDLVPKDLATDIWSLIGGCEMKIGI